MSRKKKMYAALALSLGFCLTTGSAVAAACVSSQIHVFAEEPELSEPLTLEEAYTVGSEFTVPESGIRVNGKVYPATALLQLPDGSTRTVGTVRLAEVGKYVLEYTAETENGQVQVKKEFFAAQSFTEVSGKKSSVNYGTVPHAAERPGRVASLAQGDRLVFNKAIDLTDKTKDDAIVELFVNPKTQGVADALNIVFTFTDAENPDNTVTVTSKRLDRTTLNAQWSETNSYVTANSADQPPTGLEINNTGKEEFKWNGGIYKLHRNNIYGAGIKFAMAGIPHVNSDCSDIGKPEDIADQTLSLSFDYAERRVYMNGAIVADLDDITIFPSSLWQGFETGECYLTIHATSYLSDSFNFVVTSFDGLTGAGLAGEFVLDTEKPQITIDYGAYEETGFPNAVVGLPYKAPKAIGFDKFDKDVDVSVRVYLDYGTETQTEALLSEGAFIPQKAGTYTAVYTAKDRFGNEGELLYAITAETAGAEFALTLSSAPASGETGKIFEISEPSVENGRGITEVTVTAKHASSGTELLIDFEKEGFSFRPLYAGEWEIVYNYSDYIESKSKSYKVNVSISAEPYLFEDAVLPKYLVRGAATPLPTIKGYDFSTGNPVETAAKAFVSDDGGAERQIAGSKFVSYASTHTEVIYRLGSGANCAEKRYDIPVVDVGYDGTGLRIQDYFVGEAFTAEAGSDRIKLTTESQSTQSFEFINALQAFDFRTLFYIGADANRFTKVNVYLTDSADASIRLKMSYIRSRAGSTNATVNDGTTIYTVAADFTGSSSDVFRFSYNNGARTISPSTDYNIPVSADLSGKPFAGFPSNKVYLTFELEGITGKAGLELIQLNNQPLSKVNFDLLRPEISGSAIRGEKYMGDKVVIPATFAADVLDPDMKFTMSVKTPDGSFAVADDGTVLDTSALPERDYTITLSQYGSYMVEYVCEDSSENKTTYVYAITAYDTTAPVVTLGAGVENAKVGDTVVVKAVTAEDNYTECTVLLYVKLPDGTFRILPGNSFVATRAGVYTVFYTVRDEDGNTATVSYRVTVE